MANYRERNIKLDRLRRLLPMLIALSLFLGSPFVNALDVELTIPTVLPVGGLEDLAQQESIDFQAVIDQLLHPLAQQLEGEIESSPELRRFTDLTSVTRGFANAGAAAAHLGTGRAFADYRRFAFVLGTGASFSAPVLDPGTLVATAEEIEAVGDVYAGISSQPLNASLGVNLNRWLSRSRGYVKVGYFDLPPGVVAEGLSFNSFSLGAGLGYQLLRTRQLPLGFVRWRGVTVSSGFLFQRSEARVDVQVADQGFTPESGALTFGDLGFTNDDFSNAGIDLTADTEVGTIRVAPTLTAVVATQTISIPVEVSTGVRMFWLVDLNVGAGVDVVFGRSELSLGADAEAEFQPSEAASPYVSSDAGTASFSIRSDEPPDLARPRLSAGVGLNLGPVKLDLPLMLYFDVDGYTVMAGLNVGVVW